MAAFSIKRNDRRAKLVANRLMSDLASADFSPSDPQVLCEYLNAYAKMSYEESMTLLNYLTIGKTPYDMLRLAYALSNYDRDEWQKKTPKVKAHAKILKVGLQGDTAKNMKITLMFLVVTSRHAGSIKYMTCPLSEAVMIQKKIYCGRSKELQGRSLLELTGCQCSITIFNESVVEVATTPSEKQANKQLGNDRITAEGACPAASSCVTCKKGRSQCRMAVRP